MNIKLMLILVGFLMLSASEGYSQTGQVYLSGQVDTSIIKTFRSSTISIKLNETTNAFNMGKIISVALQPDGSFQVSLPCEERFLYLSFWMTDNNLRGRSNSIALKALSGGGSLDQVYLFEQGDRIQAQFTKGRLINFKGQGSGKLNCQSQIYTIEPAPLGLFLRKAELANSGDFKGELVLNQEVRELVAKMRLAILKTYKPVLDTASFNRIYFDLIASYEIPLHEPLFWYGYKKPNTTTLPVAREYFESLIDSENSKVVDSQYMAESAHYPELLFLKELNSLRLYSKNGNYENGDSFERIYLLLKNKYKGKLRDKLLLICFERLTRKFSAEARHLLKDALNTMTDEKYRNILMDWEQKQYEAFPFELKDDKGRLHRLADYRGNVLVIDFWFTGCGACAELNAAMRPIIDTYKDNKNVVFMTINIDQYQSQWMKSIGTGKYSSLETVNLYTDGLRDQHPIIRYYNYKGAPQQLIIGKKGEIISTHPPRPDYGLDRRKWPLNKAGLLEPRAEEILSNPPAQAFMKLIEDALQR